jgi:hypothetical protein
VQAALAEMLRRADDGLLEVRMAIGTSKISAALDGNSGSTVLTVTATAATATASLPLTDGGPATALVPCHSAPSATPPESADRSSYR